MANLLATSAVDQHRTIGREEILARLQDRALAIVNVTPADSFKTGHIPGSVNLPVADIQAKARQLLADFHQEIAVYCSGPT
ncbi:MAG TPA: rhodanese-like domain-containing protein [Pyrinomonadaceae bacterium]